MKGRVLLKGLSVVLFAFLFTAGTMLAQGTVDRNRLGRSGDKIEKALKKIDLTDDQKAQIQELREEFKAENDGAFAEMKELRQTMREQFKNGDKEGAKATNEKINAQRAELKEDAQVLQEQISMILTDEQREKIGAMKAHHKKEQKKQGKCAGKRGELREQMSLTDTQKEEIAAMREDFKEANAETIKQMKEMREQMMEQVKSGDKEGAALIRDDIRELRDGLKGEKKALREEIGTVLTDEQKQLLAVHKDEIRECRETYKEKKEKKKRKAKKGIKNTAPANIE